MFDHVLILFPQWCVLPHRTRWDGNRRRFIDVNSLIWSKLACRNSTLFDYEHWRPLRWVQRLDTGFLLNVKDVNAFTGKLLDQHFHWLKECIADTRQAQARVLHVYGTRRHVCCRTEGHRRAVYKETDGGRWTMISGHLAVPTASLGRSRDEFRQSIVTTECTIRTRDGQSDE